MSYGGGYDNEGGFNEGGFGSQTSPSRPSTSDGKPRRNYDEQTLTPVTIKMLNEALNTPGGGGGGGGPGSVELSLKDGRPLHMVKVVGAVRNHDNRSTNVVIELEDGTGLIQVKVWVNESDDCSGIVQLREAACGNMTQEGQMGAGATTGYIRVIGMIKEFDGVKQLVANDVRPVKEGNEMTYHFLEVVASMEKSKKRSAGMGGGGMGVGGGMGYGIGNMASNPVQQQGGGVRAQEGGSLGGGSALNDAVLEFIHNAGANNEHGVHKREIIQAASSKGYTAQDIQAAIEHLSNEGHVYSTIDEDHYQYAM